ncbi:MAG: hypothetical protein HQK60_13460 [Deltaproteobacteria bacterium]|nr:hypothetical protein [Deltaproteobacteria bacterium]
MNCKAKENVEKDKDKGEEFTKVLEAERQAIAERRKKLCLSSEDDQPGDPVGIALSGGGVRSATICLGALQSINEHCLLKHADYISSVSGGGYTASYVHATLRLSKELGPDSFDKLFNDEDIGYLRGHASYLAPGTGVKKFWGKIRLLGAYIYSFLMNLTWLLLLISFLVVLVNCIYMGLDAFVCHRYDQILLCAVIFFLAFHFFFHPLRHLSHWLWSSRFLNNLEGVTLVVLIPWVTHQVWRAFPAPGSVLSHLINDCICIKQIEDWSLRLTKSLSWWPSCLEQCAGLCVLTLFLLLIVMIIIGCFANPNIITFHRFYRDSLADAYLRLRKGVSSKCHLAQLNPGYPRKPGKLNDPKDWGCAPYPLINTCLNLLGQKDKSFAGTKTFEHFVLSPFYCGSEITGYAPTSKGTYNRMTLATAMAVSGAAVNPNMGHYTNRILAFFMTILNIRIGYRAPNPRFHSSPEPTWWSRYKPTLWPYYHVTELFALSNSKKDRVSLSDGGHIENLGVFELLRRRCRLIIAIDASADPDYGFGDLQNLVIQARNILGVTIQFRKNPDKTIRPGVSGFSQRHYAIADIGVLGDVKGDLEGYEGLLVYIKSSMTAPEKTIKPFMKESDYKDTLVYKSYRYKTYHTAFPHESTLNQFFDEEQWEAYRQLGENMVEDTLKAVVDAVQNRSNLGMMNSKQRCNAFLGKVNNPTKRGSLTTEQWYEAFDLL